MLDISNEFNQVVKCSIKINQLIRQNKEINKQLIEYSIPHQDNHIVGDENKSALAVRWLLGQVLVPLTPDQSRSQAQGITAIANL